MKRNLIILTTVLCIFSCSPDPHESDYYLFKKVKEPNENAFHILIPAGWITEGGIFRINPTTAGAANSLEAKLDFIIKSNNEAEALMRWYPDMYYFDSRFSPAGLMGLLPSGSIYQGMTVMPLMPPPDFIQKVIVPYAHPQAANISVIESRILTGLAKAAENEDNLLLPGFTYQAAMSTIQYTENGKVFEEKMVSVIMDMGQMGAGMWKNRYTFSIRALKGKLIDYEPLFSAIMCSMTINPQWLVGEIKGQLERTGIYHKTITEINRISQEINQQRQLNNTIIQNDMFLNLTGQEEYVNPFTNEIETGTKQWSNRWSGNNDVVIYTDDPNFDPNKVKELNHFEYKRSPVKKR